ncbi:hypothetical protein F5Y12DRAFT_650264 [Xylaria sp. FL1777]|nr:hypothetical protein F5Y12DRAFT_650264 [Xylaria sp. FL1777]
MLLLHCFSGSAAFLRTTSSAKRAWRHRPWITPTVSCDEFSATGPVITPASTLHLALLLIAPDLVGENWRASYLGTFPTSLAGFLPSQSRTSTLCLPSFHHTSLSCLVRDYTRQKNKPSFSQRLSKLTIIPSVEAFYCSSITPPFPTYFSHHSPQPVEHLRN